jgi:hypothetical protein
MQLLTQSLQELRELDGLVDGQALTSALSRAGGDRASPHPQ